MFLLKQRDLYGHSLYKEPIEKGLIEYAGQLDKDVGDLTDEEISYVAEKVAEIASEVGTNVIMQGQQVRRRVLNTIVFGRQAGQICS